jgi:hypothetical protein
VSRLSVVIGALAVLAGAADAAAQIIACPAETRYSFRPREDGGRIEYCEKSNALVHGPYLATDGEAAPLVQGQFADGKAIGHWQGWYPNGRPAGEADFEAGEITRIVAWDADGAVVVRVSAADGVPARERGRRALQAALEQGGENQGFVRTIVYIAAISTYRRR